MGTDAVGGLTASATSSESIGLTAPSTAGTYYYGAGRRVAPRGQEETQGGREQRQRRLRAEVDHVSGSIALGAPGAPGLLVVDIHVAGSRGTGGSRWRTRRG